MYKYINIVDQTEIRNLNSHDEFASRRFDFRKFIISSDPKWSLIFNQHFCINEIKVFKSELLNFLFSCTLKVKAVIEYMQMPCNV